MAKIRPADAPFYAIRHIPSGFLLPAGGKGRRGHTKQDPSATRPPRLFTEMAFAARALKCYVQGKWKDRATQGYDGEWDYGGPEPMKGTERQAKDFDVVEVWLRIERGIES